MIARSISNLNILVRRLSERSKLLKRLFQVLTDYAWITVYYFWEFDLKRSDKPWERINVDSIHWVIATAEDCRRWNRNEADGFFPDDCELLLSLIEKGDRLLVGRLPDEVREKLYDKCSSDDPPDCYAVCATGIKPLTQSCFFQMHEGEGTVRTVYTRKVARGQGLATALYAKWAELTASDNFDRLFIDIESSNVPSFRAVEKAGANRIDSFVFFQIRLFKRSFVLPFGSLRQRFIQ